VIGAPLSALYGRAASLRARWYASGRFPAETLPRPTISVGNITFGGTGKTPFVEFLARRLRFEGWRPAILSRGYGRRSRGVVVVGEGAGAAIVPDALAPRRLLAVCGVANPSSFAATLAELGLAAEERLDFRDHQRYGARELARIRDAAARAGASLVVTTEKDAVKLAGRTALPLVAVRLAVEIEEPGFFPFLAERLPRRPA
jgi:tetraacyldisaccharide-1-P 4'-kinase